MNKEVCKRFKNVWKDFPDELNNSGKYQFKNDQHFKKYCNSNCDTDLEKISAGCLYLLNEFFGDSSSLKNHAKNNIGIVQYIIIWLSYMLSAIKNQENNSLKFFYSIYINSDNYKKSITSIEGCNNYKELIDKTQDLTTIDIKDISKFYNAFKSLCNLYNELDEVNPECEKYLEYNNDFFKKYEELKQDSSIAGNNSYIKIFSILLNDYDNLKSKCNNFSSLLTNSLISIAFIFVAASILLGVSYKYSLFGFRKRFQKQKLREKLKNIKKRINH
ncbi:uncharacterized protein PY17X_1101600 [Plasmodium yoelii]|uniref:PIR protein n=2 Tax=Plasmodium yoelii TaxID=5861 RepID=A0AAF0B6L5_PLAYO|nr:uncharacterized protein PY17X_1101600 [Plasmodium yoelii]WBY58380.1 PIR protein [Plasmodium yoelii yoelii]CDU18710.1 YIR protein [Plasmodium yoelii]VTZ79295.1 PIR protein [Plasmodium yoelii]|eukprot:XP_730917.2 uncharacterized protein PY17X_1101600 [Plasmodium yoelii]